MQRAVPFALSGVNPKPPKSVIVKRSPLLSLRSRGLTHNHAPAASWSAQGAFGVTQRQPSAGGSLWTTALPERGRERLANIHPRATKSHSWNIIKKPPTHRSVGRYRQGIIGYNCPCVSYGITHRHKTAHTAPTSLC